VTPDQPSAGAPSPEVAEDRWYLDDEREFLVRSLEDAEREHDAGDLSDEDYRTLLRRDRGRLREVQAALDRFGPAEAAVDETRDEDVSGSVRASSAGSLAGMARWRVIGIVASCVLIVVGVVILVVHATTTRLPGEASSGSVTQSQAQLIEQQLGEAQTLRDQNESLAALVLYNTVLSEDPTDPDALANAGWLQWKSGFAAHSAKVIRTGRREVEQAVRVAPTNYEAHLYLGVILINQDDDAAGAQRQFAAFLSEDPPALIVHQEASLIAGVYQKLGLPVPAQLNAAPTPTSAP
jgi:hypothetical protein